MRLYSLTVLAVGLLVAADVPKKDAGKKDRGELQGTWVFVSGEQDGKPVKDKTIKLTFTGDRMIRQEGKGKTGGETKGSYKMDPTKQPRTIDLTFTLMFADRDESVTNLGIYKLERDTLTLCFSGKERPTQFATKPGDLHQLMILKREKN